MNTAIISGSHRRQSNSNKVAEYIAHRFQILFPGSEADLIKLSDEQLPLWNEDMYQPQSSLARQWMLIAQRLRGAEAIVVVTPEWGGMVPPALKNFFLCCSAGDVSNKPALIVSVSSGQGGSYPVAELRSSAYKNNQICFIPEHIVMRHADQLLNQSGLPESDYDRYIRDRLDHGLRILERYGEALKLVRQSGVADLVQYPYGM